VVEAFVEETLETAIDVPVAFTKLKFVEEAVVTVRLVPVAFTKFTFVDEAVVTVTVVPVAFTKLILLEEAFVTERLVPVALVKVTPWRAEAPFETVSVEETFKAPVDSRFVEEADPSEVCPVTLNVPVKVPEGAVRSAVPVAKVNPAEEVTAFVERKSATPFTVPVALLPDPPVESAAHVTVPVAETTLTKFPARSPDSIPHSTVRSAHLKPIPNPGR